MKEKDQDLLETVEEVFDTQTVMTIYEIMRKGYMSKLYGVISTGKEARVYWAKNRKGEDVAVKIFLTTTSEFRRSIRMYIDGDPRFKGVSGDIRKLIYTWARKEYKNLQKMYEVGVRVPKPIYQLRNVLLMEFIGEDGVRAPLLKEVELDLDEALKIFNILKYYVAKLYHVAKLVHADLSEYNVMLYYEEPVLIDVSQAVHVDHPMSGYFLRRDVRNLVRYFKEEVGLNIPSEDEVLEEVLKWKG